MEENIQSYRTKPFLKESDTFPDYFIKKCKDNANKAQFLLLQGNIKPMAMEQVSYAQMVKLRQKDLKLIAGNKNKMRLNLSSKVNLQDHSVGLILTLIRLK